MEEMGMGREGTWHCEAVDGVVSASGSDGVLVEWKGKWRGTGVGVEREITLFERESRGEGMANERNILGEGKKKTVFGLS